jgi:signal peptidase I
MDGKDNEQDPWARYAFGDRAPDQNDAGDPGSASARPEPLPRRPTATYGTSAFRTDSEGFPTYSSLPFDTVAPPAHEAFDGSMPDYDRAGSGNGPASPEAVEDGTDYGSGLYDTGQYGNGQYGSSHYGNGQYGSSPPASGWTEYASGAADQYGSSGGQYGASDLSGSSAGQYGGSDQYGSSGGVYDANGLYGSSAQYEASRGGDYASSGNGQYASGEFPSGEFASGRYGSSGRYDTGELTYGDVLYARSRHSSAEPETGSRHAQPERATAIATRRRQDSAEADEADDERRHMPLWQELPLLLVVAFCLAVLIRSFLLQAFFIPSSSMEETLLVGDRVLVNKVIYDLREPHRGEVVVFRGTARWAPENFSDPATGVVSRIGRTLGDLVGVSHPSEKDFIKRVIGLPGDRVSCCDPDGRVYVNGQGINEPYIDVNSSLDVPPSANTCGSRRFDEVLVPPGQIFVMGDNRAVSQDSRCQGTVPIENVIGRAFVIVWPSSRWAGLDVPDTFDNVPAPVALSTASPSATATDERVHPATAGAAIVTLPILLSLVGSARTGRRRRWRTRTLRK